MPTKSFLGSVDYDERSLIRHGIWFLVRLQSCEIVRKNRGIVIRRMGARVDIA